MLKKNKKLGFFPNLKVKKLNGRKMSYRVGSIFLLSVFHFHLIVLNKLCLVSTLKEFSHKCSLPFKKKVRFDKHELTEPLSHNILTAVGNCTCECVLLKYRHLHIIVHLLWPIFAYCFMFCIHKYIFFIVIAIWLFQITFFVQEYYPKCNPGLAIFPKHILEWTTNSQM